MNLDFTSEEPAADWDDFTRAAFAAVDQKQLSKLVEYCFKYLNLSQDCELSLMLVGLEEMERLHLEWMDLPGPTDVMSFPMDELKPGGGDLPITGVLGDIVLCPPVAARQAQEAGHSTADELCLLTVHGILHCLGYDHATAEEEKAMFGLQRSILEEFLGRPAPVETRHG